MKNINTSYPNITDNRSYQQNTYAHILFTYPALKHLGVPYPCFGTLTGSLPSDFANKSQGTK